MLHRLEDYSECDLAVALASPHNSIQRRDELEAELIRRININMEKVTILIQELS